MFRLAFGYYYYHIKLDGDGCNFSCLEMGPRLWSIFVITKVDCVMSIHLGRDYSTNCKVQGIKAFDSRSLCNMVVVVPHAYCLFLSLESCNLDVYKYLNFLVIS